jgi:hypothetical protein
MITSAVSASGDSGGGGGGGDVASLPPSAAAAVVPSRVSVTDPQFMATPAFLRKQMVADKKAKDSTDSTAGECYSMFVLWDAFQCR